ncbi:MAG: fibronectin type III domain-containing protein [Verrucomicrobiota bacterium]
MKKITKPVIAAAEPAKAPSRSAGRTPAKPKVGEVRSRPIPASLRGLTGVALPTPAQGAIKLAFPMTPAVLATLIRSVGSGLKGNLNYPDFENWEAVLLATEGALVGSMDDVTTAEQAAKAARSARDLEVLNAETNLRNVAIACEAVDRREEALLSAGWELRRAGGGPKPLPAPVRIAAKNLPYEGQVEVRWSSITNKKYYEVQAITGGPDPADNLWETLPVVPEGRVNKVFHGLPVGSYLSVRVRAVGSRGPSPWTEIATIRVN